MKEKTKHRIHLIYSIILSVILMVTVICLMVACVGIYHSGDKPFTPESVAAAFSGIAVPVYLCLALVAGGFVLDAALPRPATKAAPEKQYAAILRRLQEKLDPNRCDPDLYAAITAQQRSRKLHRMIAFVTLALGSILFLIYGMNPANFHQSEITQSMEKAMYVLLPCMAVPFGYCVFSAFHTKASLQKEIALVKQALAAAPTESKQPAPQKSNSHSMLAVRCALLGIGIVILLYGFFAGGTNDVLTKAINICTECVGLG